MIVKLRLIDPRDARLPGFREALAELQAPPTDP